MNFFEKILAALDGKMTTPTIYSWFHIMWLIIVIAFVALVVLKCKNISDKTFRIIILSTAIGLIAFEIYKQLNFSYDPSIDTWDYQWYAFPFQFCSSPMYVLLLAGIIKDGKFRDYLCSFMATFGLFAGIAVMLYPATVFIKTIGINIQTMVHHGSMVVIGVLMYVSGRAKIEHKTVLKGAAVFGVIVVMALIMNTLFYYFGDGSTFNMLFIGPFAESCTLPLVEIFYTPVCESVILYILFLLIYVVGFTLAGYVMSLFAMLIAYLARKKRNNSE